MIQISRRRVGVNYVIQLHRVMAKFKKIEEAKPNHISLYMALFFVWNEQYFENPVFNSPNKILSISKIKSKTTMLKVLRELSCWGFLTYKPTHNPFAESEINLINFCTIPKNGQVVYQNLEGSLPKNGRQVYQKLDDTYINNNSKHYKHSRESLPKNDQAVVEFFLEEKSTEIEAKKFFNHYESVGWKTSGDKRIENWKAAARKWMLRSEDFFKKNERRPRGQILGDYNTPKNVDYNKPL